MTKLKVGDTAPDFSLPDHTGRIFTLSEVLKTSNALLVFNIGFA
jgi:peroxiredoxin